MSRVVCGSGNHEFTVIDVHKHTHSTRLYLSSLPFSLRRRLLKVQTIYEYDLSPLAAPCTVIVSTKMRMPLMHLVQSEFWSEASITSAYLDVLHRRIVKEETLLWLCWECFSAAFMQGKASRIVAGVDLQSRANIRHLFTTGGKGGRKLCRDLPAGAKGAVMASGSLQARELEGV